MLELEISSSADWYRQHVTGDKPIRFIERSKRLLRAKVIPILHAARITCFKPACDGVSVADEFGMCVNDQDQVTSGELLRRVCCPVKSANPALTNVQIRQIMIDTAVDKMAPGVDRDSGYGITMALPAALAAVAQP